MNQNVHHDIITISNTENMNGLKNTLYLLVFCKFIKLVSLRLYLHDCADLLISGSHGGCRWCSPVAVSGAMAGLLLVRRPAASMRRSSSFFLSARCRVGKPGRRPWKVGVMLVGGRANDSGAGR
jgi:hypothetical protein